MKPFKYFSLSSAGEIVGKFDHQSCVLTVKNVQLLETLNVFKKIPKISFGELVTLKLHLA